MLNTEQKNTGKIILMPKPDQSADSELHEELDAMKSTINNIKNIAAALLEVESEVSAELKELNRKSTEILQNTEENNGIHSEEYKEILEEIRKTDSVLRTDTHLIRKILAEKDEDLFYQLSSLKTSLRKYEDNTEINLNDLRLTELKNLSDLKQKLEEINETVYKEMTSRSRTIDGTNLLLTETKSNSEITKQYAIAALIASGAAAVASIMPYIIKLLS